MGGVYEPQELFEKHDIEPWAEDKIERFKEFCDELNV